MRQVFSVRFFAAVGAVAGLVFLLTSVFATRAAIDDGGDADDDGPGASQVRVIDFVTPIAGASQPTVVLDADDLVITDTQLVIDESRRVSLVTGTPGEVYCDTPSVPGSCAAVLDLLGEAVVWFALVPMSESPTAVQLPAIDTLDEGVATLVNGWQFPYAPVLDRRCVEPGGDEEFDSYRELRDELGDDFVSVFDTDRQELIAVVCRVKVAYAPPSPVDTISDTASDTIGDATNEATGESNTGDAPSGSTSG